MTGIEIAHRNLVRDLWEELEASKKPSLEDVRDILHSFLADHGQECEICGGTGEVIEERDGFSDSTGHYTTRASSASDCAHCVAGRVPR